MIRGVIRSSRFLSSQGAHRHSPQSFATPRNFSLGPTLCKGEKSSKSDDDFSLLSTTIAKGETSNSTESSSSEVASGSASSTASANDEKAQKKAEDQNQATNAWIEIMKTLNMTTGANSEYADTTPLHTSASEQPLDPKTSFEQQWKVRQTNGPLTCAKPKDGRTVDIKFGSDAAKSYGALSSIISRNNVKYELRLGERYEKPNQTRRRLKSERHRRRFAEAVREKVRLVMELKSRGA